MPFFHDTGADDEALERPIWGVFALVKDNLERVMLANIGWALQLLPALAALAFPQLPLALRLVLLDTLARFLFIILLVCALHWGPLFAEYPGHSVFFLLRKSLLLVWRYPG